jgi:hypothetical protein
MEMPAIWRLTVTERSQDMEGRRTRLALESSRPGSRLASTRRNARARSTTCLTVLTLKGRSYCPVVRVHEGKDADKKNANFKTLGNNGETSDNRDDQTAYLTAENLGVKVTVLADTGSDYSTIGAVLWRTQRSVASISRSRNCRSPSC